MSGWVSALSVFKPSRPQGLAYSRAVVNGGCEKGIGAMIIFCLLPGSADPLCFRHSFNHSFPLEYVYVLGFSAGLFKAQGAEI